MNSKTTLGGAIKSPLSANYDETFFQMLTSFKNNLKSFGARYSENNYSFLYPSFGENFFDKRKILIYGQCINGEWKPTFNINGTIDKSIVNNGWQYSNTWEIGEKDSLDWVNKHWTDWGMYRSFFWNVAYKITNKVMDIEDYKNSEEWSKYLAWSNLMKIGNIMGGNPDQYEYEAQKNFTVKLFLTELEEIKPEIAILLSGVNFSEDFTSKIGLKLNIKNKEFVVATAKVNQIKIILTNRPRFGNSEKCIAEIVEAVNKM